MTDGIINLFQNGKIFTMNAINSVVESMAIFNDKILSIGSNASVKQDIDSYIEKNKNDKTFNVIAHDLKNKCILPGFIDAHMHLGMYIYFKTQTVLSDVKSYSDLRQIIQLEDTRKQKDEWIVGFDLIEDIFEDPNERRFPNKTDLDLMCNTRPVVVIRHDGHICSANSKVLELIGLNKNTLHQMVYETGEIKLDKNGNPNGIFTEGATTLVLSLIPIPDYPHLKKAAMDTSLELASLGITTCGVVVQTDEFGPSGKAGTMEWLLIESMLKENVFYQDFVFYFITNTPRKLTRFSKTISKINSQNACSVGGIKIFSDGSFGAHTAYLYEPFSDSPEQTCGFLVNNPETLFKLAKETFDLGFQVITHAIGDQANRVITTVYADILKSMPISEKDIPSSNNKLRIEHASMLSKDVLDDCSKYGIILVCQPSFLNSEYTWLERRLGPERIKYTYPFKSILDSKITLAGASDAPVESANVLKAIQACITRNGLVPEQSITLFDAIKMFTYNAAVALHQEKIKGSLETDKLADFIILDTDIEHTQADQIDTISILETYYHGKLVFKSAHSGPF